MTFCTVAVNELPDGKFYVTTSLKEFNNRIHSATYGVLPTPERAIENARADLAKEKERLHAINV